MEEHHPDYEVVPGTVDLVTQPSHNTNQHGDIILVPTPSDSLDHVAQESVLEASQHDDKGEKQLHSALTNGSVYRVCQVLETDSFRLQYRPRVVLPGTRGQFVRQVYRPLQLAWFPAIVWSGLEYGACVSWITVLGTTTASILGSSPYNMSNESLGLIWLPPLIGGLFGDLIAGPFNDKLVLSLTRGNRGWLEPEFRLQVFIPMAFLMPGGLLLYGVGAANALPWIDPVVGMGLVGFWVDCCTCAYDGLCC
ncbi:major facilitator superfamily transporter [Fusarium mundagurra]|uniref:Major facilitator superfamily transporter n=1 Tax=Fusarium mundagurra TaxID=1567541 RepID=A0A8H5YSC7_9HYPO|nr:major facilitator superfamily transporter [Fusarium mundagurra]